MTWLGQCQVCSLSPLSPVIPAMNGGLLDKFSEGCVCVFFKIIEMEDMKAAVICFLR